MSVLQHIKDRIQGKTPAGARRSSDWNRVRREHLSLHPTCAVCGGSKKVEVHHILPFHTHPELELSAGNLITLCEAKRNGVNCHLLFGHLGDFKSINLWVVEDATTWLERLRSRAPAA